MKRSNERAWAELCKLYNIESDRCSAAHRNHLSAPSDDIIGSEFDRAWHRRDLVLKAMDSFLVE